LTKDDSSKKVETAARLTESFAKLIDSLTRLAEAEFRSPFGKIDLIIVVIGLALAINGSSDNSLLQTAK